MEDAIGVGFVFGILGECAEIEHRTQRSKQFVRSSRDDHEAIGGRKGLIPTGGFYSISVPLDGLNGYFELFLPAKNV